MSEETKDYNKELVRMWRIWKTSKQMLRDRGYEFDEDELNPNLSAFSAEFSNADGTPNRTKMNYSARPSDDMITKYLDSSKPANEPTIGTVYVEFCGDQSIGIKQLRAFAHLIDENKHFTGIFIAPVSVTGAATKVIPTVLPRIIEIFEEQDLLVNITKHELVPKHVLLSKEEKKKLLERYRLKETQLPRIQKDDPVAKYLGLRRGQVVKIIRRSETAGRYASYRWCI